MTSAAREAGRFEARGWQLTDSTRTLAVIHAMNRAELATGASHAAQSAPVRAVLALLRQPTPSGWHKCNRRRLKTSDCLR